MLNKCKFCKKVIKIRTRHDKHKIYCSATCQRHFRRYFIHKKGRRVDEMLSLKQKCSYPGCKEKGSCVINRNFFCIKHFDVKKNRTCLQCGKSGTNSRGNPMKNFCNRMCREKYTEKHK